MDIYNFFYFIVSFLVCVPIRSPNSFQATTNNFLSGQDNGDTEEFCITNKYQLQLFMPAIVLSLVASFSCVAAKQFVKLVGDGSE